MDGVNKLLDIAKETCSFASDRALAARIGVSAQQVSQWRKGANPISDDRVAQIAVIAKQPIELWMVTIRAEQADGAAAKAWSSLARRLAASAALVLLTIGVFPAPRAQARVSDNSNVRATEHGVCIMRNYGGQAARTLLTAWQLVALWLRWKFSPRKAGPDCIEAFAC